MQDKLIIPNLHVALVHYPIALLCIGTVIELFSFLYRRSSFRQAGRWMILLGAVSAVPATFSGLYAMNDVVTRHSTANSIQWNAVAESSSLTPAQWTDLTRHLVLQSAAALLSVVVVVVWIGSSNRLRRLLYFPILAMLLVCVSATGAGAWLGGEIVYRHALANVPAESTAAEETAPEVVKPTPEPVRPAPPDVRPPVVRPDITPPASTVPIPAPPVLPPPSTRPLPVPSSSPTSIPSSQASLSISRQSAAAGDDAPSGPAILHKAAYVTPPLQLHVILAGCAVALAAVSLGLSVRLITGQVPVVVETPEDINAAFDSRAADPFEKTVVVDPDAATTPPMPAARFWLLAGLLAILASLTGWWYLATTFSAEWTPTKLWETVYPGGVDNQRRLAHVVTGGVIILVPFILAIAARFSPRRKILLSILALMLFLAIAAQVWLGSLLLFDSMQGPTFKFN